MKQAHEHGITWVGEKSLLEENYYDKYMEDICYKSYFSTRMAFSSIESCINDSHKIIEWETNEMKEFNKENIKAGMLVKTTNYDGYGYGMIIPSKNNGIAIIYKDGWDSVNLTIITEVWGYCNNAHEALDFSTDGRDLLYKKVKKMTVKEICKELGYDVEIVKE